MKELKKKYFFNILQEEKSFSFIIILLLIISYNPLLTADDFAFKSLIKMDTIVQSSLLLEPPKIIFPSKATRFKIYTTTPTFKWEQVDNANGYTIYLNKLNDNNEERIFTSSEFGAIKLTQFIIPEKILEVGEKYAITMRAFNIYGWSEYSKKVIFEVENAKPIPKKAARRLSAPTIITKNYIKVDTLKNEEAKYSLVWNKTENADLYQIIIDGINSSTIFGEEYSNIISNSVNDTVYYLNQDMFNDFNSYRWKIRSKSADSWSRFSSYYYFNIHEKGGQETVPENEIEEIIMRIKYSGLIDEMIVAIYKDGKTFLPILELLSLFQINHSIEYENKILKGSRLDESKQDYLLDVNRKIFTLGDLAYPLTGENLVETELDYFLDKNFIAKITGMDVSIDMRKLIVTFTSKFVLPIYQRLLNEQKLDLYNSSLKQNNYPVDFKRNWNYLSGGFFDYSTSANFTKNQSAYYSYQLGMGAELFGGDAQIHTQQSIQDSRISFNQTTYRWRYALLHNESISNISLGNNNAIGLQSYSFRGVQISNEPIEARRLYGSYRIQEKTIPNWKVEIYQSNRLIDIVDADDKGNYDFLIPLNYGTTIVELHEFGPHGEYNIERKMYQIPIELVPEGRVDYSANFGQLVNKNENIFQSYAAYGVNEWLTAKIGADLFTDNLKYSSIYTNVAARLFDGYIFNLTLAPNAFHELSVNAIYSDLASFNFGAKLYEQNVKINPSNTINEFVTNIFLPLKIKSDLISLLFRGRRTEYTNSKRNELSLRTFYNYKSFSPSIEFDYYNLQYNDRGNLESAFINLNLNYSLYIPTRVFSGNIIDTRLVYDIKDNKAESMSISVSTTLFQKFRVQLSHQRNFSNSYSDTQLRVVFDLPFFRSNTSVSNTFVSQSIVGSINYNKILQDFNFYNRGMIGRSAATFQFFLDKNMNQYFDEGENLVPEMDISINSIGNKRKVDGGHIIVNDLESYSKYEVKLIDKNNKNPLWFPYKENFSFISDPHQYKQIEIPFYEAAEVNGTVLKKVGDKLVAVSGLNIVFEHKETKKITKVRTMSDGSYYHYGIRPGEYKIKIDEEQLKRLRLQSNPRTINTLVRSISDEENFVEFDFVLEK